jgi:hypothetical protein
VHPNTAPQIEAFVGGSAIAGELCLVDPLHVTAAVT